MIIKKSKFVRGPRLNNRNNGRRHNHYQRNTSFNSSSFSKFRSRGNPNQLFTKYLSLAKNAISIGDSIQAEYYFQYADHFSRILNEEGNQIKYNKNEEIKNNNILTKDTNENNEVSDQEVINEEKATIEEDTDTSLDSVSFLSDNTSKTK